MKVGSLFSGIGGIDLGLERAGFTIDWMCEKDPYALKVLNKHWPGVLKYTDIREMKDVPYVDVVAGGFPCQDISTAGKQKGIDGERSGLWREFVRIIRMVRPRYVLVENVSALLAARKGSPSAISRVLGELSESGYDAEWEVLSAQAFGAPHKRERVFIVGYSNGFGRNFGGDYREERYLQDHQERDNQKVHTDREQLFSKPGENGSILSNPYGYRSQTVLEEPQLHREPSEVQSSLYNCGEFSRWTDESRKLWETEPDVGRVVDGVPSRVDRLRCLGNAVVPQIAEWIGECILEHAGVLV